LVVAIRLCRRCDFESLKGADPPGMLPIINVAGLDAFCSYLSVLSSSRR
jgi:hypothetical protein